MKWMRIICIVAVLLAGVLPSFSITANEGQQIFVRVWETDTRDQISMVPSVSSEGLVFGISGSDQDKNLRMLVCIKDGQVLWRGSEIFANGSYYKPLICGKLVIASGFFTDPDENITELRTFCYTKEGEKLWERRCRPNIYDPILAINNGMLWTIVDGIATVCDPQTGLELKTSNIHQMLGISDEQLSTANQNDGRKSFDDCSAVFLAIP